MVGFRMTNFLLYLKLVSKWSTSHELSIVEQRRDEPKTAPTPSGS